MTQATCQLGSGPSCQTHLQRKGLTLKVRRSRSKGVPLGTARRALEKRRSQAFVKESSNYNKSPLQGKDRSAWYSGYMISLSQGPAGSL